MTIGLQAAMAHLRDLAEGKVAGARYALPAGLLRPTDGRVMLEDQPEQAAHHRYEILPVSYVDGFKETGPANVTGQLVDSTAEVLMRVAYYWGGGGDGDLVGVPDEMASDAFLLRRCLTFPGNYLGGSTTIVTCTMGEASFAFPSPPERRALLTFPMTLQLTEDWSSEA